MVRGGNKLVFFLIYLVVGGYLINIALKFYKIPEAITNIEIYIIGFAGLLVILGGINYLRLPTRIHER